jgi:3-methyladenine DNA glycosylase AlkD
MNTKEATQLGEEIATLVQQNEIEAGYARLAPVLAERTPFPKLERIGAPVGKLSLEVGHSFASRIAADRTEGGWVVIGAILREQIERDPTSAFQHCRKYIISANVWYGTDILGERIPGPALVNNFETALALLAPWRADTNAWVRRAVGVAAHFWAKRSRGEAALTPQAGQLLDLLEPMFTEWEMDTVKGVGWGLKTLGKYYPDLVADWLSWQIHRKHRTIMVRKAITFLPANVKDKLLSATKF